MARPSKVMICHAEGHKIVSLKIAPLIHPAAHTTLLIPQRMLACEKCGATLEEIRDGIGRRTAQTGPAIPPVAPQEGGSVGTPEP